MARIKFTGYIETFDIDESSLDLGSYSGLSEEGYLEFTGHDSLARISELEDLEIELIP